MQTSTPSDTPDHHHPNSLTVTRNPEQYGKVLFTNAPQLKEPALLVPADMLNEQTAPTTAEMDKQLIELRHQWAVFAAYRNTRAPISKLPDETLSIIFFYYGIMTNSLYDLGWTSILLHVCRRWKSVALANPAMWSYVSPPANRLIYIGRPRKTDKLSSSTVAQLRRSGAHPLSFKLMDRQSKGVYETFNALIPHLDRVRHFELAMEADVLADFVADLGRSRRTGLQHLRLESTSRTAYSLPDDAGQNILVDLHTLILNNVAVNWASIRNIVCLDITKGASQDRTLGVLTLVGVLQACPMLEDLSLVECVSGDDDALHEAVSLPQLRRLHVCDASSSCKTVIDVVQPSPLAAVSVYATDVRRGADIKSLLGKSFRDWARTSPPLRAIAVATRSTYARFVDGFEILFFTNTATLQGPRDAIRQSAHLLLRTCPRNSRELRSVTRKILRAVPTNVVNDLDLRFSTSLPNGTCRALLDALPALCSLKFPARPVAESFLRGLGTLVHSGSLQVVTRPYKEPLAVPALEQITFDTALEDGEEYHETEMAIGRELLIMLEGYAKLGRPIRQIVFENGGLAITQEMQLRIADLCDVLTVCPSPMKTASNQRRKREPVDFLYR